jgi:hypothetical protein
MKRLMFHNFLYILCLVCIYYETDLKKLFIVLYRLLNRLFYLEDRSIDSVLYITLENQRHYLCQNYVCSYVL